MTVDSAQVEALKVLCTERFQLGELRCWVEENHPGLASRLPGGNASQAEFVHAFVSAVRRDGDVDPVLAELQRFHETRRLPEASGSAANRGDSPWLRRHVVSRNLTVVLAAVWVFVRAYPTLDVSRALMTAERSLFGFLPVSYQRIGLLGAIVLMAVFSATAWFVARDTLRRR